MIDDSNDKESTVNDDDMTEQNNDDIEDTVPLKMNRSEMKFPSPFSSVTSQIVKLSFCSEKNPHLIN